MTIAFSESSGDHICAYCVFQVGCNNFVRHMHTMNCVMAGWLEISGMAWSWHNMKGVNTIDSVEVAISNVLWSGHIFSVSAIFSIKSFSKKKVNLRVCVIIVS